MIYPQAEEGVQEPLRMWIDWKEAEDAARQRKKKNKREGRGKRRDYQDGVAKQTQKIDFWR